MHGCTHLDVWLPCGDGIVGEDSGEGESEAISEESLTRLTVHIPTCQTASEGREEGKREGKREEREGRGKSKGGRRKEGGRRERGRGMKGPVCKQAKHTSTSTQTFLCTCIYCSCRLFRAPATKRNTIIFHGGNFR